MTGYSRELSLSLDHEMLRKVVGYYVYRSEELLEDRPIVDGLYLRRKALDGDPPERISLVISWT